MLRDFRKVFKGSKGVTGSLMVILSFGLLAYLGTAFQTTHPDSPDAVLARVYGHDIKRRDLHEEMSNMIRQYQSYGMQDNMDSMMPFIQQQAMNQLMQRKLQEELANRHGVTVTDAELRDSLTALLKSWPVMLDSEGRLLETKKIRDILAQNRMSLKKLEEGVRRDLVVKKLLERAAALVPVDELWLDEEYRARNEKLAFDFVSLSPATMAVPDPGDAVLEGFLKESGNRFQQSPRRVLQIVSVEQSHFGDSLLPDEETLSKTYESKKPNYLQLKASHILLRGTPPGELEGRVATPEELEAAREKLLKIRTRIIAGADFAKVAAAESEDPSAKANSGDLGWFGDGAMVKEFWDGALALKKGEISQPIKSGFGYHLIKLVDRKERTFEEVKPELASEIVNERFSAMAKEKLEQLRKRVGEKGDLGTAAAALGLTATLSDPFSSDATFVEGMAGVPQAVSQAFSMTVGQVSPVVSASGRFVVYRVQKELPIAVPPLREIRAKVLEGYRQEEARSSLMAKFNDIEGNIASLGFLEIKNNQTFAEITELAENLRARQTFLSTPVGDVTKPVWTNDGKLWIARIKERTSLEPLSSEKRLELLKEIQNKESFKLLEAELRDLSNRGHMRKGFNSLWGRFGGIYVNETALQSRTAHAGDY